MLSKFHCTAPESPVCYNEHLPKYLQESWRPFHCPQIWPIYGSVLLLLHWDYTAQARPAHQDAALGWQFHPQLYCHHCSGCRSWNSTSSVFWPESKASLSIMGGGGRTHNEALQDSETYSGEFCEFYPPHDRPLRCPSTNIPDGDFSKPYLATMTSVHCHCHCCHFRYNERPSEIITEDATCAGGLQRGPCSSFCLPFIPLHSKELFIKFCLISISTI